MKIAREALPLAALFLSVGCIAGFALHPWAGAVMAIPLLFTLWFFRDPERVAPADPLALISPADGKVIKVGPGTLSIFMNVFDVHVCRTPMAGQVQAVEHTPGRFIAAYKDSAAEHNERAVILIQDGARRLGFTLVAGLVARRIVCNVRPGQRLRAGERVGLIQFGSRVDVRLPEDGEVCVKLGQRVVAGQTIIARWPAGGPPGVGPGAPTSL